MDAFYACLDRRVPEGRVLSHDLLEGSYLRAGLLGEVELTDGFPYQVRSYYARPEPLDQGGLAAAAVAAPPGAGRQGRA